MPPTPALGGRLLSTGLTPLGGVLLHQTRLGQGQGELSRCAHRARPGPDAEGVSRPLGHLGLHAGRAASHGHDGGGSVKDLPWAGSSVTTGQEARLGT